VIVNFLWGEVNGIPDRRSDASIATEHLLDLFIGGQVSPGSASIDDLPFFIAQIVNPAAPQLDLLDELHNLLLIGCWPTQHTIESILDLISCHDGPPSARDRAPVRRELLGAT
jgi:hypothetical protein